VRVAITGTPGTGKTSVSRELSGQLGLPVVDVNRLLTKEYLLGRDDERDTLVVDAEKAAEEVRLPADAILDGHLSHVFPADIVVVLRCRPKQLYQRLVAKGWPARKVEENVEAEALNIISEEAREHGSRVFDIDTTSLTPAQSARQVIAALEGGLKQEQLDFLEYL
jgi:adenylate kinase